MTDGTLRCIGTSVHLKSKFGEGYRLTCNVRGDVTVDSVVSFVNVILPNAALIREAGRTLVFTVPTSDMVDTPKLFADMETQAAKALVQHWSIAMATLEDVFVNVIAS